MEDKKENKTDKQPLIEVKKAEDLAFHYWQSIHYFIGLIRSSELKAGLILSFYGILLNFVYQNAERTMNQLSGSILLYVLLGLWFVCTLASIYFSIRSFIPRIESKYDTSIFFFGDIVSKFGSINDFSKKFYAVSSNKDERFDQLGQQIYINAKIAATKFKNVNMALRFLAISLFILLTLVIYYLSSLLF